MEFVGAADTFRLDVTQTGKQKLAGLTFGAKSIKFDHDILTDSRIDGRRVSVDGQNLDAHLQNKNNPHGITLQQLGSPLSTEGGKLKVTADVLTDRLIAGRNLSLDGKNLDDHLQNKNNPHGLTLKQLAPFLNTADNKLTVSGEINVTKTATSATATSAELVVTSSATFTGKDNENVDKTKVVINSNGLTIDNLDKAQPNTGGGRVIWGNGSQLQPDQGGSIELGGNNATAGTGTPYIDFHFKDKNEDFNTRIVNDADGYLSFVANKAISLRVAGSIMFDGYLGTNGSLKDVQARAKEILKDRPPGTLLLYLTSDTTKDLWYAYNYADDTFKTHACQQSFNPEK